jgi:two-component system, chemotaxis family, chemotaxis protein CheY
MTGIPRLLVVDDDATIREMLEMVLDSEGYEVVTAPHGAAAFALLDTIRPNVILLDMKMPIMDGWGFLEQYRRRPGVKVPVVVLTAAQDDSRRASEVGADAYVAKPFAIDELIRVLNRCIAAGASDRAAPPERSVG